MYRFLLFLFTPLLFLSFIIPSDKEKYKSAYVSAIEEYLKATAKEHKTVIDTFYIGPSDSLKNIGIPSKIQNIPIVVVKQEGAAKLLAHRKSFTYANVVGWVNEKDAEFILITFLVNKPDKKAEWNPLHNCNMNFSYNSGVKKWKKEKLKFDYAYQNKYTNKKNKPQ